MSNPQFSEPAMEVPLRLRSFYGRNIEQMPLLLSGENADGEVVDVKREPIIVKQVLHDRVHSAHEQDRTLLRDNYIDTGVAIIVDPNGSREAIVGLYSDPIVKELVQSLNPKSALQAGSLPVTNDQYQAVKKEALVLSPDVANALRSNAYSQQKQREAFWDYVTEGDAGLVRDNLTLVQERNGGNMSNRMGVYVSSNSGMRLVSVGAVGDSNSDADGLNYLDLNYGRLVGVAAEPLVRENLEFKVGKEVVSALGARTAFEYNGTIYAPVQGVTLKKR